MPCLDDGPGTEIRDMKERLDTVTGLLCGICEVIDDAQPPSVRDQVQVKLNEVFGLIIWWDKHQREDAALKVRESNAKATRRARLQLSIEQMKIELEDL